MYLDLDEDLFEGAPDAKGSMSEATGPVPSNEREERVNPGVVFMLAESMNFNSYLKMNELESPLGTDQAMMERLEEFMIANGAPVDAFGRVDYNAPEEAWENFSAESASFAREIMYGVSEEAGQAYDASLHGRGEYIAATGIATGTYGSLLNVIADAEANGDYNIVYNGAQAHFNQRMAELNVGRAPEDMIHGVTDMTIGEIMQWQRDVINETNSVSSAVGAFQFVGPTFRGMVEKLGVGMDEKFDEAMQQRFAMELLREAGVPGMLARGDIAGAENAVASKWASIYTANGGGAYDGYAGNNAYASAEDVLRSTSANIRGLSPELG